MTVGEIIEKCMPPRCVRWRYSSHESLRLCVCVDCHDFASRVDYVKCLSTSYSRVRGFLERRRITAVAHLCRFPTSSISLCGKRVARRAAILSSDSALFSASRCVGVHVFFISSIRYIIWRLLYTLYETHANIADFSPTVSVGRRASRTPCFCAHGWWGCWRLKS